MRKIIFPFLAVIVFFGGCKVSTQCDPELVNLQVNRIAVDEYYSNGSYEKDLERITMDAGRYLDATLSSGSIAKPAIVFDIDDTLLGNAGIYKQTGYAFRSTVWTQWVNAAEIPPIASMQALYASIGARADIFIITGRNVFQRAQTLRNLERAGYSGWKNVFFKEVWDRKLNAEQYKTKIIQQLIGEGYHIVVNFGDQESDFGAKIQGRNFKLPNYIYITK